MSNALSTYQGEQRKTVVMRRLSGQGRGLGYLAARDAAHKLGIKIPKPAPKKKVQKDVVDSLVEDAKKSLTRKGRKHHDSE